MLRMCPKEVRRTLIYCFDPGFFMRQLRQFVWFIENSMRNSLSGSQIHRHKFKLEVIPMPRQDKLEGGKVPSRVKGKQRAL
jgi:hypothetical protein